MRHFPLVLITLCLAFAGCKKDSNNNDDPSSEADFFFLGKVDGQQVRLELLPTGDIEMTTSNSGSIGPPDCTFDYGAYLASFDLNKMPQVEVSFVQFFSGDCGDENAVFNSLFPTGSQVFQDAAVGGKGVLVHYIDDSGNYSSALGPQTTGQFTITKSEPNDTFGQSQTIAGTVTCTLYDEFGGKKELTGASFRLNFRPWF